MHQINVDGRWLVLGDFLEQQDGGPAEIRRRVEAAQRQTQAVQREEQLRHEYESQLAAQRAGRGALRERLTEAEKRSSRSPARPGAPLPPDAPPPPSMIPCDPGNPGGVSDAKLRPGQVGPAAAGIRLVRVSRVLRSFAFCGRTGPEKRSRSGGIRSESLQCDSRGESRDLDCRACLGTHCALADRSRSHAGRPPPGDRGVDHHLLALGARADRLSRRKYFLRIQRQPFPPSI